MLRRLIAVGCLAASVILAQPAAGATAFTPPAEFGTDWHDPITADPPVAVPPTASCTVKIVDTAFRDFTPYTGQYAPPAQCPGPWAKVVLRLDGQVAGRQFDRLGYLTVGGVTIFKTSTPEPSPAGIAWRVEKDATGYSALFAGPQPVSSLIGNVVDSTYTGVLYVQVYLTFYASDAGHPAPVAGAAEVLGLTSVHAEGQDQVGTVTVPRNTERLVAEVFATGSGGGCEEFWYITAPPESGYSCPADRGPYREVQISVDGQLAGIAAPYPHVYTGGWSNPFLWYVLPAPRAFDIQPIRYDLSPFVGRLTDGRPHTVSVGVLGVPAGQSGWDVPVTLLGWRDNGSTQVTGALTSHVVGALTNSSRYANGTVTTMAAHRLSVSGYVLTSHGRVDTAVTRELANSSTHTWGADENPDALHAGWTDHETRAVTRRGVTSTTRTHRRYAIDGTISIDAANRLTTTISLTDGVVTIARGVPTRVDNTYQGAASWTLGVPRDQRHPTGESTLRFRIRGNGACYDRTLTSVNGELTVDHLAC